MNRHLCIDIFCSIIFAFRFFYQTYQNNHNNNDYDDDDDNEYAKIYLQKGSLIGCAKITKF